jgi:hypothetical protein
LPWALAVARPSGGDVYERQTAYDRSARRLGGIGCPGRVGGGEVVDLLRGVPGGVLSSVPGREDAIRPENSRRGSQQIMIRIGAVWDPLA